MIWRRGPQGWDNSQLHGFTADVRRVGDRWFAVGSSTAADANLAGREATASAVGGRPAKLALVFAPATHDMLALAAGVRVEAAPDTVIVGCSTARTIAAGTGDGAVVVAALGGPGFQVAASLGRDSSLRRHDAGAAAAESLAGVDKPHRVLVLLTDGLAPAQHEIVRGAYSAVGATVPLVGGAAGDDLRYARTYQIFGTGAGVEVFSDAVVGVAIGSDAPLGVGIAHGWRKHGEPVIVTGSSGGRMYEIDHEPAVDVYQRRTGIDPTTVNEATFRERAYHSPLGLSRRSGEDIRVMHGVDLEDGSVQSLADVPQGALAWFMRTDHESMIVAAGDSTGQAVAMLAGAPALGVLSFDCAVRYTMLGPEGVTREIGEIARVAGAPIAGFYTYGEIARTRGARGMHHLTCVSLALA